MIICFSLWGAFSIGTQFQKRGRIAGEVFGKEVSFQEYNLFYRAVQIFNFGRPAPKEEDLLRERTWQNIIYSREAKLQKIEVTDAEVRQEILRLLEDFQLKDPSPEVYRNWLSMNLRETPQEFESQVREFIRLQKLVHSVNDPPVPHTQADEDAALLQFKREHNLLSAEISLFSNLEEAKAFRNKVKGSDDWKKETRKMPGGRFKTLPKMSLEAWSRDFKVPEEAVWGLHRLAKGAVSEPVQAGNEYAVFLILDPHVEPEDQFNAIKDQYFNTLDERKKYERFVKWHFEVEKRAHLKDHLLPLENETEPESKSIPPVLRPVPALSSSNPEPSPAPSSETGPA